MHTFYCLLYVRARVIKLVNRVVIMALLTGRPRGDTSSYTDSLGPQTKSSACLVVPLRYRHTHKLSKCADLTFLYVDRPLKLGL